VKRPTGSNSTPLPLFCRIDPEALLVLLPAVGNILLWGFCLPSKHDENRNKRKKKEKESNKREEK